MTATIARRDYGLLGADSRAAEAKGLASAQCPTPYRSVLDAYREIIPALLRQRKDPSYFVVRHLPAGAKSVEPTVERAA